jgi:PAS domain S-box-containing protein
VSLTHVLLAREFDEEMCYGAISFGIVIYTTVFFFQNADAEVLIMLFNNNHKFFLAAIVESSQDSIVTINFDMVITSWNRAAELVYGYTAAEAVGKPLSMLMLPRDLVQLMTNIELIRQGKVVKVFETERVHKDRSRMILEIVLSPVKNDDGEIVGISTIARDLTMFKEAENAIREKDVLNRLLAAQEEERNRIALDLHDEMGQQVTSLRFKLKAAKISCKDEATCEAIDEMERIAQELDNSVDFIAWQLRPPSLAGVSLADAIQNYAMQWMRRTGINLEFLARGLADGHFRDEVEIALYRIVQESLNNTYKHAHAKNVQLLFEKRDGSISLIVEDDGKGFVPDDRDPRDGIGLRGISERASLINGSAKIESAPGRGTTVYVRVPVD